MKIFLAGGHISGKYQQFKDYKNMKLYLASPHTLLRFRGGYNEIRKYINDNIFSGGGCQEI